MLGAYCPRIIKCIHLAYLKVNKCDHDDVNCLYQKKSIRQISLYAFIFLSHLNPKYFHILKYDISLLFE